MVAGPLIYLKFPTIEADFFGKENNEYFS